MKYLDFQKGGFINDFSKIFIGKFPQWVDFNINSFAVSPPNKEVFDKNILADLRARNSDPELIVYVDSFVNQIEMIEEEEKTRIFETKRKDEERIEEEELTAEKSEQERNIRERNNKAFLNKLDQKLQEENIEWEKKFKPKEEELKTNVRESENKDREHNRKLQEDDVQSERKQKEADILSDINMKKQQAENENEISIAKAKTEAEAISIRSKAGAEEIEKERKGLDVYAKKIEIETAAKIKIMHELSNIVANLKNIKGVFAPDYPNVRTIINGGENKNEIDILLSLFTGLLAKHLDSELGTELKQITNKIINKKKE